MLSIRRIYGGCAPQWPTCRGEGRRKDGLGGRVQGSHLPAHRAADALKKPETKKAPRRGSITNIPGKGKMVHPGGFEPPALGFVVRSAARLQSTPGHSCPFKSPISGVARCVGDGPKGTSVDWCALELGTIWAQFFDQPTVFEITQTDFRPLHGRPASTTHTGFAPPLVSSVQGAARCSPSLCRA